MSTREKSGLRADKKRLSALMSDIICKRSRSESIQLKSPPKIKSPGDRKKGMQTVEK